MDGRGRTDVKQKLTDVRRKLFDVRRNCDGHWTELRRTLDETTMNMGRNYDGH